jgi:quercetin dioxygenase-like cupin family protein
MANNRQSGGGSSLTPDSTGTSRTDPDHHTPAKGELMNDSSTTLSQKVSAIPSDDLKRSSVLVQPDKNESLPHIGLVGDTYTILVTGADTAGRFCVIDMHIPPGGGPPPHRHDFEETFIILEGQIATTFRGEHSVCERERLLIFLPTPHISSTTHPQIRCGCYASVLLPDRRIFSGRSVFRSRLGRRRPPHSTKRNRRHSEPNLKDSP